MSLLATSVEVLAQGLGLSLAVFAGAAAVALPVAVAVGLARHAGGPLLGGAAGTYVEAFRGTSAMVQLYWAYFVLPFAGVRIPALAAAIAVLGLNAGAYGAELVRGALAAVPRGQREAALALGLSPAQGLVLVTAPQAAVAALPPLGNLLVELLKNTSLVSLIGLADLAAQGQLLRVATSGAPWVHLVLLGAYLALAQILAWGMRGLERRLGRWRSA